VISREEGIKEVGERGKVVIFVHYGWRGDDGGSV